MTDPKTLEERAEAVKTEIHRLIHRAAKWSHNADRWGNTQGERNFMRFGPDEDKADPWESVFDELDSNVLKEVLAFAREVARETFVEGGRFEINRGHEHHAHPAIVGVDTVWHREALRRWPR